MFVDYRFLYIDSNPSNLVQFTLETYVVGYFIIEEIIEDSYKVSKKKCPFLNDYYFDSYENDITMKFQKASFMNLFNGPYLFFWSWG